MIDFLCPSMEEKEIKIFIKQKAMSLQRNQFEFLFQWSSTNLNLIWCLGLVHSPLSASSYWRTAPRKIYNTSFKSLTFSFHLYFSCCTHLKAVTITLPHVSWMLQSGFHWECLLSWWVGRGGGVNRWAYRSRHGRKPELRVKHGGCQLTPF